MKRESWPFSNRTVSAPTGGPRCTFIPTRMSSFIQLSAHGKVIVSHMPAGKMEGFFRTTDAWTSPPSQEQIVQAFEDHDMKELKRRIHIFTYQSVGLSRKPGAVFLLIH